jgi:Cu2+-exporting ATPase
MMREKARSAVRNLVRLSPRGAMVIKDDGSREYLALDEIEPGMHLAIAPGDRIPVDGRVIRAVRTWISPSSMARAHRNWSRPGH